MRLTAGVLILFAVTAAGSAYAQSGTCAREADSIRRAESQLPRLDIAPPGDKQIVCITLETNLLFAKRLSAHLAQCPRSPLARNGDSWRKNAARYGAQFQQRHCKPTIRGYRG